jgi:hypothetical protein
MARRNAVGLTGQLGGVSLISYLAGVVVIHSVGGVEGVAKAFSGENLGSHVLGFIVFNVIVAPCYWVFLICLSWLFRAIWGPSGAPSWPYPLAILFAGAPVSYWLTGWTKGAESIEEQIALFLFFFAFISVSGIVFAWGWLRVREGGGA